MQKNNNQVVTLAEVANRVNTVHAELDNWRAVGDHFGITGGMAYRIAVNNYEPKDPHIRNLLHLPALVPAPVCRKCGQVHVTKRCTNGRKPAKPGVTEHAEQVAIFTWAALQMNVYPELKYLFAVPNGGYRAKTTAVKLKREGVRRGVPDMWLPVSRNGYHGLVIELKVGDNTPTDRQREWLEFLNLQGYYACWIVGADAAKQMIEDYLNGRVGYATENQN